MKRTVIFAPEADEQLRSIRRYISSQANPVIAKKFVDSIVERCRHLADWPYLGTPRDQLRPGLRTIGFWRRVTIAYAVEGQTVEVVAVSCGGRNLANHLS